MKILSKLDNTGMIEEVADKKFVTDEEKLTWNGKADKTYVDSQDELKADKTYVDGVLNEIGGMANMFMTSIIGAGYDIENDPTLEQLIQIFVMVLGDYEPVRDPSLGEIVEEMERNKTTGVQDLGTFSNAEEVFTHMLMNQISTGYYTLIIDDLPYFMLLEQASTFYRGTFHTSDMVFNYFKVSFLGEIHEFKEISLRDLDDVADLADLALKADITYVDSKVQTDVPAGAKFTDTITSVNGQTGDIELTADDLNYFDYSEGYYRNIGSAVNRIYEIAYEFMLYVLGSGYVIGNDPTLKEILEMLMTVLGDYDLGVAPSLGEIVEEIESNKTTAEASLELKADKTYVDNQDALKADKTYVDSLVGDIHSALQGVIDGE